jgi:hypothetical protein
VNQIVLDAPLTINAAAISNGICNAYVITYVIPTQISQTTNTFPLYPFESSQLLLSAATGPAPSARMIGPIKLSARAK